MTFVRRREKIPRYKGETRKEPDSDFRHLIGERMESDQPESCSGGKQDGVCNDFRTPEID